MYSSGTWISNIPIRTKPLVFFFFFFFFNNFVLIIFIFIFAIVSFHGFEVILPVSNKNPTYFYLSALAIHS